MTIEFTCLYCNHKWQRVVYSKALLTDEQCSICKDKNLKLKDKDEDTIDYYQGSPPFSDKPKTEEQEELELTRYYV